MRGLVDHQIHGLRTGVFDIGSGGVEVVVVGNDFARATHQLEEDAFRRPALMGGQDMREPGELLHLVSEAIEALRTGVGLVTTHHRRPLQAAHGAGFDLERLDHDYSRVKAMRSEQLTCSIRHSTFSCKE
jgi:hypothetical protein